MQASSAQEIALLQKYEAWVDDAASSAKEYAVAVHVCCNGEDHLEMMRPEFALFMMNEHLSKNLSFSVLIWRAWLLWWTRAEQLHRWSSDNQANASQSARTLLACANANAWYKAWHWALEEQPGSIGMYLNPAREKFSQAMVQLKEEKTLLRSILQIAMKEEPWYETARLAEQQALSL